LSVDQSPMPLMKIVYDCSKVYSCMEYVWMCYMNTYEICNMSYKTMYIHINLLYTKHQNILHEASIYYTKFPYLKQNEVATRSLVFF